MNRLKSHALFLCIALFALSCASTVRAGSVKGASVAVYNSGRALVTEARSVTLPKGLASVVFKGMPTTLDPTSVRASAKGMRVFDLQFTNRPITTSSLLNHYLGKEISVIMPDPGDGDARILRKATLVSNQDRPIFLVGNEVYTGNYEALLFPGLPKDLDREPTLTLTTDNKAEGKREVRLSYLIDGLSWRADYALSLNAGGDEASLDAWATVTNDAGCSFSNASLKLVAGQVNQAMPNRPRYANAAMLMEADSVAAASPAEESFSQFHVYSAGDSVSLDDAGTRQINLFDAPRVGLRQELVSRFSAGGGMHQAKVDQNVELSLYFANTARNGLGRPMPGGLVRVFMPARDGFLLMAGESRIGHTPVGNEIKLTLGQSFDVTVERTQTSFSKLGKNSFEMAWSITARNGSGVPQMLTLRDSYPGQWKIVEANMNYKKADSGTVEFDLSNLPPTKDGKGKVVTYRVQVTY